MDFAAKKPLKGEWEAIVSGGTATYYRNPLGIMVGSGVHETDRGHEWLVSISSTNKYENKIPSGHEIWYALECFGATDFERDDHGTKITANYWKPINADMVGECECKK